MNKSLPVKNADYYLELPYHVLMQKDDEGDFVASVQELDGCIAHGDDPASAWKSLKEIQKAWIEDCLDAGEQVPEPEEEGELPSGRWVQRVPRTLHKKLVDSAKKEGVSLNQLVTSLLASSLAAKSFAQYMTVAVHDPTFHVLWAENAQIDWLVNERHHGAQLGNLGLIHRLLPAPEKKKDAYDPKEIFIHKDVKDVAAGGGRR